MVKQKILATLKKIALLTQETMIGWSESRGTLMAAGIAYYALFSLAPLLSVAISVAGLVFGESTVATELVRTIETTVSPEVAANIKFMIEHSRRNPPFSAANWVSILISVTMASLMFVQLKQAINQLWGLAPQPGKALIILLRTHFLSFLIVFLTGLMLLVSMVFSTGLISLERQLRVFPEVYHDVLPQLNFGLAFLAFTAFFAIIFKYLPDAQVCWRDVLLGGAVTSLLFTAGEFLIGKYVGSRDWASFYGIASSIIMILVWIYYSMQVILLGAKFTQVLANNHGRKVLPSNRAEIVVRRRVNTP